VLTVLANVRQTSWRFGDEKPGQWSCKITQPSSLENHRLTKGWNKGRLGITGPHSRAIDRGALGRIDGRSRAGRFLRQYEKQLTEHVGGSPTITQRAIISRAARVALHLELMDEKSLIDGHEFGKYDHNYYVSWSNSLARLLSRLGLQPTDAPAPSLQDVLSGIAARRAQPEDEDDAA
jgi:hypothetical protein